MDIHAYTCSCTHKFTFMLAHVCTSTYTQIQIHVHKHILVNWAKTQPHEGYHQSLKEHRLAFKTVHPWHYHPWEREFCIVLKFHRASLMLEGGREQKRRRDAEGRNERKWEKPGEHKQASRLASWMTRLRQVRACCHSGKVLANSISVLGTHLWKKSPFFLAAGGVGLLNTSRDRCWGRRSKNG